MGRKIISMANQADVSEGKRLLIVVDFSNLLYRAYYSSIKDLEIRPWIPVTRALDMLRTAAKRVRHDNIPVEWIFAGDSARNKLDRNTFMVGYKGSRPSLANLRFYIFRRLMAKVIKDIGCEVVICDGSEGDDVIATVVKQNCHLCDCNKVCNVCKHFRGDNEPEVVIFSCDKDLNVLLKYRGVRIYREAGLLYTREDFAEEFGFHPREWPVYKSLCGDKSDAIPGVDGWGPSRAKSYILNGSLVEETLNDKELKQYRDALRLIELNYDVEGVPRVGWPIHVAEELFELTSKEYGEKAYDDIVFAEKRLEAECQ